jgi:mycothiol synthase
VTSINWRTSLSGADQQQIRALIATATERDGIAPVGDQVLRELGRDRTRHLVAADGDEVIGYLNLAPAGGDDPAMAELVVHPDARRQGTGSQLARAGLSAGGPGARIWAHGNLEPARALAAQLGLVIVRELLQMRRPLADLPPQRDVPGVTIRTYQGPKDDAELLRVNNAAFSWHPEQGGWTEQDIVERRHEAWFDPTGLFLAFEARTRGGPESFRTRGGPESSRTRGGPESPARLLGFHWTKIHAGGLPDGSGLGEVYVVGVDPSAQGRGLGSLLTLTGLHHLAAALSGTSQPVVMLYVEANNSAAVNTYRKLGFEVAVVDAAYGPSQRD